MLTPLINQILEQVRKYPDPASFKLKKTVATETKQAIALTSSMSFLTGLGVYLGAAAQATGVGLLVFMFGGSLGLSYKLLQSAKQKKEFIDWESYWRTYPSAYELLRQAYWEGISCKTSVYALSKTNFWIEARIETPNLPATQSVEQEVYLSSVLAKSYLLPPVLPTMPLADFSYFEGLKGLLEAHTHKKGWAAEWIEANQMLIEQVFRQAAHEQIPIVLHIRPFSLGLFWVSNHPNLYQVAKTALDLDDFCKTVEPMLKELSLIKSWLESLKIILKKQ